MQQHIHYSDAVPVPNVHSQGDQWQVPIATNGKRTFVAWVILSLNAWAQAFCISVHLNGSCRTAQSVARKGGQKGTTQTLPDRNDRSNRGEITQ